MLYPSPLSPVSPAALWRAMFAPGRPRLFDVCTAEDAAALGGRLPGSLRRDHRAVESDGAVVIACHRGLKLSQGAAALLQGRGAPAVALDGGLVGWVAAGLPLLKDTALAPSGRYVCPREPFATAALLSWVIHRLLPPESTLIAVDSAQMVAVAERFDARPLADPDAVLVGFGLSMKPLHDVAMDATRTDGSLARALRGVALIHGDDARGHRAAAPLLDAALMGAMA